jgi:hypothetical protein
VVYQPPLGPRGIDPHLHHFQYHEAVLIDEAAVEHAALEVDQALFYQRGLDPGRGQGRQPERLELVGVRAGAVADVHNCLGKVGRGHGQHAFPRIAQRAEAEVPGPSMQPMRGLPPSSMTMWQRMAIRLGTPSAPAVDISRTGPGSMYLYAFVRLSSSILPHLPFSCPPP